MAAISIETAREVQFTLTRWAKESAMHFCRLAQLPDARFENIVYPTGLKTVRVSHWQLGEGAEVPLLQAKELRSAGYRIVSA